MKEFTKSEKQAAIGLIRRGILHRHAQWHKEIRELLDKPYGEDNEFDRSMEITKMARDFYKEAMDMENYYSTSNLIIGIAALFRDGHILSEDIDSLPEKVAQDVKHFLR